MSVGAKIVAATAGLVAVFFALAPIALADTPTDTSFITAYPAKPYMVGKHEVTLHVQNTGTVVYDVEVRTSAPWIVPSVSKIIALQPGETAELIVKVKRAHPHGTQQVSFIIPPSPESGGIVAEGGVAIPLVFDPAASSSPIPTGTILWPFVGVIPLLLYGGYKLVRRRRRAKALRDVGSRLTGLGGQPGGR